jgi:hypothetical protein
MADKSHHSLMLEGQVQRQIPVMKSYRRRLRELEEADPVQSQTERREERSVMKSMKQFEHSIERELENRGRHRQTSTQSDFVNPRAPRKHSSLGTNSQQDHESNLQGDSVSNRSSEPSHRFHSRGPQPSLNPKISKPERNPFFEDDERHQGRSNNDIGIGGREDNSPMEKAGPQFTQPRYNEVQHHSDRAVQLPRDHNDGPIQHIIESSLDISRASRNTRPVEGPRVIDNGGTIRVEHGQWSAKVQQVESVESDSDEDMGDVILHTRHWGEQEQESVRSAPPTRAVEIGRPTPSQSNTSFTDATENNTEALEKRLSNELPVQSQSRERSSRITESSATGAAREARHLERLERIWEDVGINKRTDTGRVDAQHNRMRSRSPDGQDGELRSEESRERRPRRQTEDQRPPSSRRNSHEAWSTMQSHRDHESSRKTSDHGDTIERQNASRTSGVREDRLTESWNGLRSERIGAESSRTIRSSSRNQSTSGTSRAARAGRDLAEFQEQATDKARAKVQDLSGNNKKRKELKKLYERKKRDTTGTVLGDAQKDDEFDRKKRRSRR